MMRVAAQLAKLADRLLQVTTKDPDDARRRRLLNVLLFSLLGLTLLRSLLVAVSSAAGLEPPGGREGPFYLGVSGLLSGSVIIYVVNRYWSGWLAGMLFVALLVVSAFVGAEGVPSGSPLVSLAIPIAVASVVLRPYASFVAAALVAMVSFFLEVGVLHGELGVAEIMAYFGFALVSWITARGLERAVAELRAVNQDLDRLVAERADDAQRQSIQLQTAAEVACAATAVLDVQDLLDETVHLISESFGFYHVGVYLLDRSTGVIVLRAVSSEGGQRMLDQGYQLDPDGTGLVPHVVRSGQSLVLLDVNEDVVRFISPGLPNTRSALAIPLISRGRVIGVLDVQSTRKLTSAEGYVSTLQTLADQLANAIENAHLYEEANRRVEELTALHKIDMAITSTLNLGEVLQIILAQVGELLDLDVFYVALYDEQEDEIDVRLLMREGRLMPPCTVPAGEDGIARWVIHTRQPVWVGDCQLEKGQSGPPVENDGFVGGSMRSLMVLPLISRGRTVGVISAQASAPEAFSEDDRRLFVGIARQASIAVVNARLYEEVERRLAEAQLIQVVTMAAASTLDFDLVLERTVKELHRALGIDRIGFMLPDEEGRKLVIHPSLVGYSADAFHIPVEGSLAGEAYRTGRPVSVCGKEQCAGYFELYADVCSAVAVPVRVGDRIVAVLRAEDFEEDGFTEDELAVFITVAGQLGVVLENARLYQEMARHAQGLRVLADASAGMMRSLALNDVVRALLNVLAERFRSPCGILLVDAGGEAATWAAGWMPGSEPFPFQIGSRVRVDEHGWLSRVAESRKLMYVTEVEQSSWWTVVVDGERPAEVLDPAVEAILTLPMVSQDRLLGIISLQLSQPLAAPVDEELDWCQALVNQATAALSNAHLYQQLELQAAELSRAYDELQEIDRLRTQLVQNVSHELRTPLGLIKGYVELLAEGDLGQLDSRQDAALQVIRERTAMLSRLINNLTVLQVVRRDMLVLEPVSLVKIVWRVLKEFQSAAEDAGIAFEEHLEEGLPPVAGDRERLDLVIGHLVDNAIKFSPRGGTVSLRTWADQGEASLSITDEGIGIPPAHLGRIFDRFYQVDGSARRRYQGMGVGLALVWEIVEAHDGAVTVESEEGKGSTFTVSLPLAGEAVGDLIMEGA